MGWNGTKTWAVGDPATSSDMNAYIRDNLAFLYGDATPTALTVAPPWAWTGGTYTSAKAEVHGNTVQLSGELTSSAATLAGATLVAAVPTRYRPAHQMVLNVRLNNVGARLDLTPGGVLTLAVAAASGSGLSLTATYSLIA